MEDEKKETIVEEAIEENAVAEEVSVAGDIDSVIEINETETAFEVQSEQDNEWASEEIKVDETDVTDVIDAENVEEQAETELPITDKIEPELEEFGEMIPAFEMKIERDARVLTSCRNAPCDISDVKNAERTITLNGTIPTASSKFRLIEAVMAASSWPAAVFAACFITIMVIAGYCSVYNLISAAVVLAIAICGIWLKKTRLPLFSLVESAASGQSSGNGHADEKEINRVIVDVKLKKTSRRSLRSAEYAEIFMSILLGLSFVILSIFLPIGASYFIAMLVVFLMDWYMAGQYVSVCTPYCDVYDVTLDNDETIAMISFDTPIPGEDRRLVKIDDRGYLAILRDSTRKFLENESETFALNKDYVITRK